MNDAWLPFLKKDGWSEWRDPEHIKATVEMIAKHLPLTVPFCLRTTCTVSSVAWSNYAPQYCIQLDLQACSPPNVWKFPISEYRMCWCAIRYPNHPCHCKSLYWGGYPSDERLSWRHLLEQIVLQRQRLALYSVLLWHEDEKVLHVLFEPALLLLMDSYLL